MWTCSQAHLPTCVVPLSLFLKVVAKLQQQEEAFFGSSAQAMQWRQFNQSVQLPLLLAYKFSAQTFSPLQQKQANDSSSKRVTSSLSLIAYYHLISMSKVKGTVRSAKEEGTTILSDVNGWVDCEKKKEK